MPPYTLGQAAKATGKQKSTILDAIRAGRLSGSRDERKQWQIDPAELFRVYPPNTTGAETEREETPTAPYKTELLEEKIRHLERENSRLEQIAADLRTDREDLRNDRDHWRRQATHLLTHQPKPEPEAQTQQAANQNPRRSLWAILKKWV